MVSEPKNNQQEPNNQANIQRYVSKELTHFVGGKLSKYKKESEDEQFNLLIDIIQQGQLTPCPEDPDSARRIKVNPTGSIEGGTMQEASFVSFCDIPVDDLKMHMKKYSRFGLSFGKDLLLQKGVNPVFYIAQNSIISTRKGPHGQSLVTEMNKWVRNFHHLMMALIISRRGKGITINTGIEGKEDIIPKELFFSSEDLFDLYFFFIEHIFSFLKTFEDENIEDSKKNYYMEREWRIWGNLEFNLNDVYRVVLPRSYSKKLREKLPNYFGQITFSD